MVDKEHIRNITGMLGGNTVTFACSIFRGFIIPKALLPTHYGYLATIELIRKYADMAQLGLVNAANRELPYHKDDKEKVSSIRDSLCFTTFLVTFLISLAILGYGLSLPIEKILYKRLLYITSLLVCLDRVYGFYEVLFQTESRFQQMAQLRIVRALVLTGLSVLLVWSLSYYAVLFAQTVALLSAIIWSIRKNEYRFRFRANLQQVWSLYRLGFLIFLDGVCSVTSRILDRSVIALWIGQHALGIYSLGFFFITMIEILPESIIRVLYPRAVAQYGEHNDIIKLVRDLEIYEEFISTVFPFCLALGYFGVAVITTIYLPKYSRVVIPFTILLGSSLFYQLSELYRVIMYSTAAKEALSISAFGALCLNGFLNGLVIKIGWQLPGIAGATTISFGALYFSRLIYVHRRIGTAGIDIAKKAGKSLWPPIFLLAVACASSSALSRMHPGLKMVPALLAVAMVTVICYSPVLYRIYRKHNLTGIFTGLMERSI